MTAAEHPTRFHRSRRHLDRPTLAVGLVVAALVAIVIGAVPAGAQPGPQGGIGPMPTTHRLCVITPYGCHVHTTFAFRHTGEVIIALATFPAGTSGTVRFTLRCPDGYTEAKTATITADRASAYLSSYGEHPVNQICTMTQGVAPDYETSAFLTPSTFDDLWPVKRPTFANVARS